MIFFGCIDKSGHYLFDSSLNHVGRHPLDHCMFDGVYPPQDISTEGVARCIEDGRFTFLAFWDRSVDHRPGSNAAFIEGGSHSFDEMIELAKQEFPSVMARFKFPITEYNLPLSAHEFFKLVFNSKI